MIRRQAAAAEGAREVVGGVGGVGVEEALQSRRGLMSGWVNTEKKKEGNAL